MNKEELKAKLLELFKPHIHYLRTADGKSKGVILKFKNELEMNKFLQQYADEQIGPIIMMLKAARCPNGGCDNNGTITTAVIGKDGWPEPAPEQCQWCYNRELFIEEFESNQQNQ